MKKLILLFAVGLALSARAQNNLLDSLVVINQATNAPRTAFESFIRTPGAVLTGGWTLVGSVSDQITSPIDVRAEKVINQQSNNKIYAVTLVTRAAGKQAQFDFVDYDELDGLIQGIRAISHSSHPMANTDDSFASIHTKCGLLIVKFSTNGKTMINVASGMPNGESNWLEASALDNLGEYLTTAKARLEVLMKTTE